MATTLLRPPPPVTRQGRAGTSTRSRRSAVLLAGLALVTLGGTGAAAAVLQRDAAAPPAGAVPVGVTVPVGGLDLTVTRFERRREAVTGPAELPLSRPALPTATLTRATSAAGGTLDLSGTAGGLEHGQERVDVSVVVRARPGRTVSVDHDRFRLTSAGRPVDLLQPVTSTLSSTPLPSGAAMRGGVVLVVPEGVRPLELAYGDGTRVVLDAGPASGPADGADTRAPALASDAP